jgi:hypothetical protein
MPRHSSSSIRSNKASVSYKFPVFFFQGKISREEIAFICVAALASPNAVEKTFEVKSTVPFSEPFVVDPSNPPPEKDYDVYFKELKAGITGKEALEGTPAQV